jgi:DnaK suppressor protein
MMNQEMILKFKGMFEEQRKQLMYSQEFINEEFFVQKDDLLDEVDITSTEMEQEMRMRLRNREALFLKKLDEALARINDGSFGTCGDCGDGIEFKRLEARPTATLCVHCKEEQERGEHMHIDGHQLKSLGKKLRLA